MRIAVIIVIVCLLALPAILLINTQSTNVNVEWESDGEWITFSCGMFILGADESALYIMRPDGSDLQRITNDELIPKSPSWSPAGNWIAFLSKNTIYKMRPDGTELSEVIAISHIETTESVSWSPVGESLIYNTGLGNGNIYLTNSTGTENRQLLMRESFLGHPRISPDGRLVAYAVQPSASDSGLYILDLESNEVLQILDYDHTVGLFTWSVDGSQLLVTLQNELYTLSLADRQLSKIHIPQFRNAPEWSPDGNWLVFSGIARESSGTYQIFKSDKEGMQIEQLTDLEGCNATSPQWISLS